MTSRGLRGLDIDWEEKLEVGNAFRIKRERRECRCIGAQIHDGGAMPNEGIARCAGEWIDRGRKRDMRR